jgi:hypothetical protein
VPTHAQLKGPLSHWLIAGKRAAQGRSWPN